MIIKISDVIAIAIRMYNNVKCTLALFETASVREQKNLISPQIKFLPIK